MFYYLLRERFIPDNKPITQNQCRIIIRAMGYRKDHQETSFYSDNGYERTQIEIRPDGVWIKAYASGYGESDFLNFPVANKMVLKKFIRANAV